MSYNPRLQGSLFSSLLRLVGINEVFDVLCILLQHENRAITSLSRKEFVNDEFWEDKNSDRFYGINLFLFMQEGE